MAVLKVALINPPEISGLAMSREGRCTQESGIWGTQWPPITLAYLASLLGAEGHEISLFDGPVERMSVRGLVDALRGIQPDLCFLPVSTPSFRSDMAVIRKLADALPSARFAVLGVHATRGDREILEEEKAIRFVIRNEPEETAAELARAVGAREPDLSAVSGLTHRSDRGVERNPDRPFIADLDSLPFPAWDHVARDLYRLPFSRRRFLSVVPLRGCPYACTFCTAGVYYGRRLRLRSVDSVVREIEHDRSRFGVADIFMWAETFTLDRGFVLDLCRALKARTPGIRWTCTSRTDTVDEEMLSEMAGAGCWMMSFGIESTSPAVLDRIRKKLGGGTDPRLAVAMARRAGIRTVGHFILGLPGETRESMAGTVRDARGMDLDFAQFYVAAPFVGSALHDEAVKEGWLAGPRAGAISQSAASLRLPGLDPAEVDRARRGAILKFYARPKQIGRLLQVAGWGIVGELFAAVLRGARRWGKHVRPGDMGRP